MNRVSRIDIVQKLKMWESGEISREEVFRWADDLYFPGAVEFDDREGIDAQSVANEVLSRMAMLDVEQYGKDIIPIFLRFLNTPNGNFYKGYQEFVASIKNI